jgi:cellulose synthase/poly-beta-1,6-N-acetylglucosamine synthase-like glycosyltransferase
MIMFLAYLFWTFYLIIAGVITFYCGIQLHLLMRYWNYKRSKTSHTQTPIKEPSQWPPITIQLPVFNEFRVIERLLEAIAQLDYPTDQLEIQILDDSTDKTTHICREVVQKHKLLGKNWNLIHRTDRVGFKAGALQHALQKANYPFIAIFDADFMPSAKFLKESIRFFTDRRVGAVQARWGYSNKSFNWLTKIQALQLNVHFTIEQKGRSISSYFNQFNGTAGIWRKSAIEDAGGWQADTIAEDLDLSIRAQLKGWKINFVEEVTVPSELPIFLSDYKQQQARWITGGVSVLKKLGRSVLKSKLNWGVKLHALVQMGASLMYGLVYLLGILGLFLLFLPGLQVIFPTAPLLLLFYQLGFFSLFLVFGAAQIFAQNEGKVFSSFPLYLINALGLSNHYSLALGKGLFGKSLFFHRTPKYGSVKGASRSKFHIAKCNWNEGVLSLVFGFATCYGIIRENYYFLLLHGLLTIGFFFIFLQSIRRPTSIL